MFNSEENAEYHAVCHECSAYIGKFEEVNKVNTCHICNTNLKLQQRSSTNFFIVINPSVQISDLLHTYENYYSHIINNRVHVEGVIKDIYDGKAYREFVQSLPEKDRHSYVSLTFNTDGAAKFKCSKYSVWPIYLMINEIPPQDRFNKLIICGLWFSNKKPDMGIFLDPFVDIMNKLSDQGINCFIKAKTLLVRPYVITCCVDSMARAPIQGIKQFNGKYGCSWCLHPGEFAEGSMRYPLLVSTPDLRKEIITIKTMLQVSSKNSILGIKHPSPLINLSNFKVIDGFCSDYMHCCLEGVGSQVTEYFIRNFNEMDIQFLDDALLSITVPNQISRLTRPLSARNEWKAREWENFILYYSAPLFSLKLNLELLNYWLLFVNSLYILLQQNISITELDQADEMLHKFVGKTEELFGIGSMTYNIHQLLHLCKNVFNWGPLWAISTFAFEAANYHLLRAIKCSKGVPQQILRFINLNHNAHILNENLYKNTPNVVQFYCSNTINAKINNITKISDIVYLGKGENIANNIINSLQLSEVNSRSFRRMINNGCLYTSLELNNYRSNNSFVQLKDGNFMCIIKFIVDEDSNKEITLGKIVTCQ